MNVVKVDSTNNVVTRWQTLASYQQDMKKAETEMAARGKAAHDQEVREKAVKDKGAREKAARKQAAKNNADKEARITMGVKEVEVTKATKAARKAATTERKMTAVELANGADYKARWKVATQRCFGLTIFS